MSPSSSKKSKTNAFLDERPKGAAIERKLTMSEDAYRRLSRDIVSGRLQPDQKLGFDMLRSEYGFGISPLREALQRLSSENLVAAEGRVGFRVAPISLKDLQDINALRLQLEPMALRDAVQNGGMDWESAVVSAAHRLSRMPRPSDPTSDEADAWEECHRDFHDTLISACSSRWLLLFCRTLFAQFGRYRRLILVQYWKSSPLRSTIDTEHKRVVEAIVGRDADKAAQLLRKHYDNSGERVVGEYRKLIASRSNKV